MRRSHSPESEAIDLSTARKWYVAGFVTIWAPVGAAMLFDWLPWARHAEWRRPVLFWGGIVTLTLSCTMWVAAARLARRTRAPDDLPHCSKCGYSLRGIPTSHVCPECGTHRSVNTPIGIEDVKAGPVHSIEKA